MSKPMRAREAANYLSVTLRCIYRMTESKQIPFYKPSDRRIFFKQEELDAWIFRNRSAADYELNEQAEKIINGRAG